MIPKICCIIGHRKIPCEQVELVKTQLKKEIGQALEDGYTYFVSGFTGETDFYFAEIVGELRKKDKRIRLEANVSQPNRYKQLMANAYTKSLLESCSGIVLTSECNHRDVSRIHCRYMVVKSSRVIAVYDGRETGGTAASVRFARTHGKELREISI